MLPVDDPLPPIAPEEQEGDRLHASGLDQGEGFKHLVQRSKAAGKDAQGAGPHQEMHFTDREVVEVEGQVRRHIGIGGLFVLQDNVEPDGLAARLIRAAVSRLHHAGAAAGADHPFPAIRQQRAFGDQTCERSCLFVVAGQIGEQRGLGIGAVFRGGDARAAEQDHG